MSEQSLSWNSDPKLKAKIFRRLKADHKAQRLVKGQYWENGKGCAVGCMIRGNNHAAYETELGLPEWLARLEDTIFEGLPNSDAQRFAIDFIEAIPVGKDLTKVKWKFCAFVLSENIERVLALNIAEDLKNQVVDAIRQCLAIHKTALTTGTWDESAASAAWSAARSAASAARSAAWSAAWSAARSAESAARSAARSAAWSAARSAESAASAASAAWSAARSAAWSAAYQRYAKKLLELLSEEK